MTLLLRRYVIALAALLPAPVVAQKPSAPSQEVVVVAKRTLDRQIADFVSLFTADTTREPLPRFERSVCPVALGFSATAGSAIAARVRKVAQAAGVDVGKGGCSPNVLIIVTADKKLFLAALADAYPDFRNAMSRDAWRALTDSPQPAVAWQTGGPLRNTDGRPLPTLRNIDVAINQTTLVGSRIVAGARPQVRTAIVIMEERALAGLSVRQIADYAAMRTLMRADPTTIAATAAPTILKALTTPMGSEIPLSLTEWDLGALRSFYAASLNTSAAVQNGEMRSRLKKELSTEAARK